jgi:hypothetical protein
MANSEENSSQFFVDRSLGKSIVTELRKAGFQVLSMADVYGEQAGQNLADETWLADAGKNNWVVLTKDDAIRRRPAERDVLIEAKVRVFCLTNRNLRAKDQVNRSGLDIKGGESLESLLTRLRFRACDASGSRRPNPIEPQMRHSDPTPHRDPLLAPCNRRQRRYLCSETSSAGLPGRLSHRQSRSISTSMRPDSAASASAA